MEKKNKFGKVLKVGVASAVVLTAGVAGHFILPRSVSVENPINLELQKQLDLSQSQLESLQEDYQSIVSAPAPIVEPEVITVTEQVDNGKLDLVLKEIYDNNGQVSYLTDDLDDDEVSLIADRIILVNDFKALAIAELKKNLFDELDGETVDTEVLDDKDMERLRINDDADEISIDDIDFEDKDADLSLTGTFEQDDIKYDFEATVSFKDGEVDEISDFSVTKQ